MDRYRWMDIDRVSPVCIRLSKVAQAEFARAAAAVHDTHANEAEGLTRGRD